MTVPTPDIPAPPRVRRLARGAALTPVWENGIGGLTFRTDDGRFIKHGPLDLETNMRDEAERMRWAAQWARVPRVIEQDQDDAHEWLVTMAIPGDSAIAPRWIAEPATAVRAIGEGLRMLHEALPVEECPWEWSVGVRIDNAETRGIRLPVLLRSAPPIDQLVVCHGDACAPNTILDDRGAPVAHVDLAALGIADRWADIAVASMSTEWNFGPGWEDALIAAYGVEPDRERLAYYRDLWNAT